MALTSHMYKAKLTELKLFMLENPTVQLSDSGIICINERSLMIRRELKKKGLILSVGVLLANVGLVHLSRPEPKSRRCHKCLWKSIFYISVFHYIVNIHYILYFTIVHEPFALCKI